MVVAIGINALGYREVLGIAVGDSEAEGFWRQFLGSLKERGLDGTRLVISDAHLGLTASIRRMFQGCCWQRCRVHFLRNLLSHVPKAGQDMVAAAMKAVFVIQAPDQVRAHWQWVTEMSRKQFPTAAPIMEAARDDVLAFLHFPQEHWRKVWSTNPLERLNKEIKRRTKVVGIFPNDAAITRPWAVSCWSNRRNRSWSAAVSSLKPPWPGSLNQQKRLYSPMESKPIRRQRQPAKTQQPLPCSIPIPSIAGLHIQRSEFIVDERS